jgi:hypothetical protein
MLLGTLVVLVVKRVRRMIADGKTDSPSSKRRRPSVLADAGALQ